MRLTRTLLCLSTLLTAFAPGCTVIVESQLENKDAGPSGIPCESDRQCVSQEPDNCQQACVGGFCTTGTPADDGTVCGAAGMRICQGGFCEVSECGDGYPDRGGTPPEYCDDGNSNDMDGCTSMCTRACGPGLPNCDDGDSCGTESCMMIPAGMFCRAEAAMPDGTACNSRTVMEGTCVRGTCVAND